LTILILIGIINLRKVEGMKKRSGRPEIPASQRRKMAFRFVATKEEAARIRAKAKAMGLNLSEYLRKASIPRED
jgi:hypothetical protein